MDTFVVATVQQRLRLTTTEEEHREQLRRFLRVAANKRARLVIFPELAGLMVVPPLLRDMGSSLLKRADRGRRARASLWQKTVGGLAGGAAGLLKATLAAGLAGLLDVDAGTVWEAYVATFAGLAREFGVTLVAPGAYLPDPADGVLRNLSALFGPSGELLGTQAKVMLGEQEQEFCKPGATWDVIHTELGALGLMLGNDVLYPEVGRLLAFQGAEMLVALGAYSTPAAYHKHRSGLLARMQDNQLFAASAYTVGPNPFARKQESPLIGKAAVFAPQELTPRGNGVLVEMGNQTSEGVLSAEWNFVALRELWAKGDMPLRRELPASQAGTMLAALYVRLQNTPRLADGGPVDPATGGAAKEARLLEPLIALDELPVLASVTSRWPLHTDGDSALPAQETIDWEGSPAGKLPLPGEPFAADHEEETDEMDALAGSNDEKR